MKIRLNNVRLAFPSLFVATTVQGQGEPAFSASFILTSDHPQLAEIRAAMEKWALKNGALNGLKLKRNRKQRPYGFA